MTPEPLPRTAPPPHHVGRAVALAATVVVVAGLVTLFVLAGERVWHHFRNPGELRALMASWGAWAPLGIILLQGLQIMIAPLPGTVVSFVGGYALGFWPAIVWLMLGVLFGATINFLLARFLGRRLLRYLVPPGQLARIDAFALRRGTFFVFLLLLIPNPVGDFVYYLAGLTPMPLLLFVGLVFVGRLPSNVIESLLGSQATRFGWVGWAVLGAAVVAITVLYYLNQRRIETWLVRVSTPRPKTR